MPGVHGLMPNLRDQIAIALFALALLAGCYSIVFLWVESAR